MLSHGKEGDVLMMGADNELKWTNLSYAIRNASKTVFDTLQVLNFPLTNGSINDVNGFIDGNGILEFPAGTDIELIITPAPGYGLASVKLNGTSLSVYDELSSADSLPNYIVEKGVAYLEIENASGNYNIEVEFKQCVLVLTEVVDTFPAVVSTVMIPYGKNYSYTLNKKEGCGIDSIFVDGRNVVSGLSGSVMSLDARADTIYLRVVYKSGLMSVGDAYDWGGANNAYVYEVTDNGFKVVRLFSRITYNWNQLAVISSGLTDGWSTPNNTELSAINEHPNVMNALFTGYDVSNQDVYVWSNTSYGSGNEMAYGINVLEGIVILDVNMPMYVLVVKEVIKN